MRKLLWGALLGAVAAAAYLTLKSLDGTSRRHGLLAPLVGNADSQVVHARHCRFAPAGLDAPTFATRAEAEAAGYRPCGVCRP
jgi:hypothetical protein